MKKTIAILLSLVMVFALFTVSASADFDVNNVESLFIIMTCNGQSDAANDCIGANLFAQYIQEASGGKITVQLFNNDQLAGGDMTKGLELVVNGDVQIDIHSTSIISRLDNSRHADRSGRRRQHPAPAQVLHGLRHHRGACHSFLRCTSL